MGQNIQTGATAAGGAFNRFVEGDGPGSSQRRGAEPEKKDFWDSFGEPPKGPSADKQDFWDDFGAAPKGPSKDKQDFWDEFSSAGEARSASISGASGGQKKPSGIGTSAMKKKQKNDEAWGDW